MASPIFTLADSYVTRLAALDPVWAGMRGIVGDHGAATDYGPDGIAARADLWRSTLASLDALDPPGASAGAGACPARGDRDGTRPARGDRDGGGLSAADRLAADHLRERLTAELASSDAGEPLRAVRSPFGLLDTLRDSVELLPRTSSDDWVAVVARLAAVPAMLASWRTALEVGRDRGLVAARRQVVSAAASAQRMADDATFATLVEVAPAGLFRADLAAAAAAAHAALADTARFLRDRYAPGAAEADAVGPERHAIASRLALGADLDPRESYEWGWAELHRIEAEIAAEADAVRPGAGVAEAVALLDQTRSVPDADAYLDWLRERHAEAISALDGVHFDLDPALRRLDVVLATASGAGAAYYTPPSEDLARPGRTWWPLGGRDRFAVWAELTTVFHEGVPGHHLQLGQTRVVGDRLSRFSRISGVSGHGEGWALYAERLADELGLFDEPGTRLGMLKGSALRAARVVIDIGLHLRLPLPAAEARRHGPEWTFDVACDVLRERGHAGEFRIEPEVRRYCGWPAQATSYKLGERAWLTARDDARRAAGASFDLKAWHTAALNLGPIGLAGLPAALARAAAAPDPG